MLTHSFIAMACMLVVIGITLYKRRLRRSGQTSRYDGALILLTMMVVVVLLFMAGVDIERY